jgi:FtsZ-binding cell division protein ZapB
MNIGLHKIRIDGGTQSRVKIDENVVAQYADDMLNGAQFPSIVLFHDGVDYWLADGFHRYFANKRINSPNISADVRDGGVRDAILEGISANNQHGLRPSNEDKRKGVMTMLKDIEWQDYSNREIATICGVSHTLVNDIRKQLEGKASGKVSTPKPPSGKVSTPDPAVEFNEAEIERETLRAAADTLQKENEDLQDKLTVAMAASTDDVEKEKAQSIIKDLRAQIRLLEIELKAVTTSRDQFQRENAQLMKQVAMLQKKLNKLEGK